MSLLIDNPEATQASADEESASMSSLIELEEIRAGLFPVSVEAYQLMTEGEPTELLRGIIIKKASKSPTHRLIGRRLHKALCDQISAKFQIYYGEPLTFVDSVPEPDIAEFVAPRRILLPGTRARRSWSWRSQSARGESIAAKHASMQRLGCRNTGSFDLPTRQWKSIVCLLPLVTQRRRR